ncbi:MAG: hypothetical protein HY744_26305 [Deltaproteobacteria bacterium]|nr:hypothetical protein [Deltaproteobacteria bacterium]
MDEGTGGSTSTSTSSSSSGASSSSSSSASSSSSSTSGQPPDCTGLLEGECGVCLEGSCCDELGICGETEGCMDCLTGGECTGGEEEAQAVATCAQDNCEAECFGEPPPAMDPACKDVPDPSPSKGACAKVGDPGLDCNPVTNEPCDGKAGQACDSNYQDSKFQCYDPPNENKLCTACGDQDGWCLPTYTCVGKCAKYCCDNADCGPEGVCDKTIFADFGKGEVGACLLAGAGGAGGGE